LEPVGVDAVDLGAGQDAGQVAGGDRADIAAMTDKQDLHGQAHPSEISLPAEPMHPLRGGLGARRGWSSTPARICSEGARLLLPRSGGGVNLRRAPAPPVWPGGVAPGLDCSK